jgi:hypothetical protein
VAVLPENDQGLAYVRNWIIAHARAATGGGWIWMLDDDITRFFRVEGARCVPAPAGAVLRAAEAQIAARPGATLGALEYQQYAWRATGKPALNGYCDVAVCVHTGRFRGHFRADMDLKLDRDIVLQVLTTGGHTVRVTDHAFAAPKNGSNKGGLYDDYAQDGREAEASRRLAAAWPGLVTAIVKPDGRPDAKINWRAFSARAAAKRDRDLVARR